MKRLISYLSLVLSLSACDTSGRVENTKELNAEIKASQIKRVTNTQLIYSADEWGKKISKIAEKSLTNQLAQTPERAGEICKDLSKIPVIAALQKEYGVHIQ